MSRTYKRTSKISSPLRSAQELTPEPCAVCREMIDMNGCDWVITASRKTIHMGGKWQLQCWAALNGVTV